MLILKKGIFYADFEKRHADFQKWHADFLKHKRTGVQSVKYVHNLSYVIGYNYHLSAQC